jgi:hypothetical protein
MIEVVQGATRSARSGPGASSGPVLALLASAVLLVIAVAPERAAAVSRVPKGAVQKLRHSPCPPKYAVRVTRPATRKEIRAAKHRHFDIAGQDVHIRRNMNWAYDPIGAESFRARLNDLRWLDVLFYAYRENGDRRALQLAKRIVVDWVESNPLRHPLTDRSWFDKVAGDRGPYIAYATRAAECEGMLGNRNLARKLLGSVEQHIRFLAKRSHYSNTNRGLFMDLGLIFSGRQTRFLPGATKARNRGERRFTKNVNDHVIPGEGMWLEHSTTYQFLTINAIMRYLEIEKKKRPALDKLLKTMIDTSAWLTETDLNWVQAGDSYQDRADRFAQPIARDQRGMRVLMKSGVAFVKKKRSYLSLLSDYHSEIHRHSDDLSFDLYEDGHRVVSDTGIPDKDFGTPYLFAISAEAHSVVQVDGEDFPRDREHAYGSGILASGEAGGWYAVRARNPLVAAQGVDHRRLLLYKPGTALIVADRLRSSSSHKYQSNFQYGPDFGLQPRGNGKDLLHAGSDQVTVFHDSTDPTLQLRRVRGQTDPLLGFVYPAFRERNPRWTETTLAEGSDVDNVTTLSIGQKKDIHASAVGPLGATSTFAITKGNDDVSRTITVTQHGTKLLITQAEVPSSPAP